MSALLVARSKREDPLPKHPKGLSVPIAPSAKRFFGWLEGKPHMSPNSSRLKIQPTHNRTLFSFRTPSSYFSFVDFKGTPLAKHRNRAPVGLRSAPVHPLGTERASARARAHAFRLGEHQVPLDRLHAEIPENSSNGHGLFKNHIGEHPGEHPIQSNHSNGF